MRNGQWSESSLMSNVEELQRGMYHGTDIHVCCLCQPNATYNSVYRLAATVRFSCIISCILICLVGLRCSELVQCELMLEMLRQASVISNALLRPDFN